MRFLIEKDFDLSYSHQLVGLPQGHKCGRVHGHNATIRISLGAEHLDGHDFVVDYGDMHPIKTWLDNMFDHRHVNDVVDFNPTAERLAMFVYYQVQYMGFPIIKVGWSETPRTWAWYEPDLNTVYPDVPERGPVSASVLRERALHPVN